MKRIAHVQRKNDHLRANLPLPRVHPINKGLRQEWTMAEDYLEKGKAERRSNTEDIRSAEQTLRPLLDVEGLRKAQI